MSLSAALFHVPISGMILGLRSDIAIDAALFRQRISEHLPEPTETLATSIRAASSVTHDTPCPAESQGSIVLDALTTSSEPASVGSMSSTISRQDKVSVLPIVSRAASARLFKVYFTTIHPMWPVIYKPMYDLIGYEGLADTLPAPVLYAMYSIAACVQPQHDTTIAASINDPSPAQLFQATLLAIQTFANGSHDDGYQTMNLLKPSIEICQALTILTLQQYGLAESSSAALMCGLAASMAIDLRLNRNQNTTIDPSQSQVRSRLWWNLYTLDKMLASELGRPVILRSEDTDMPFPSATESDEYLLLQLSSSGQAQVSPVKAYTLSGFHTTIKISQIMERVCREVYSISARTNINENSTFGEEIRLRLWRELQDYHRMFDSSHLRLDLGGSPPPPVTITNMAWMWCATILLHRPFISAWQKWGRNVSDRSDSLPDPANVCITASKNICSILERYSDNFATLSSDLIYPIFTAGSTLSHYLSQNSEDTAEDRRKIDLCIRWLLILGKNWKNARACHRELSKDFQVPAPLQSLPIDEQPEVLISRDGPDRNAISSRSSFAEAGVVNFPPNPSARDTQYASDDWGFLNSLGDLNDELYTMDANFRDFLTSQYDAIN